MELALGAITRTVPISLFNRGLAGKIFDEVKKQGAKVVMKNNTAEVVLISPDEYKSMCNEMEDLKLALMAKDRLEQTNHEMIRQIDVDKHFGFTDDDLDGFDEVEFE